MICAAIALYTIKGATALRPSTAKERPSIRGFLLGWTQPWKSRDFVWVWGTRFLGALGLYLIQPYLRNYMEDSVRTFEIAGIKVAPDAGQAAIMIGLVDLPLGRGGYGCPRSRSNGKKRDVIAASHGRALGPSPWCPSPGAPVSPCCSLRLWGVPSEDGPSPRRRPNATISQGLGVWQMTTSSVARQRRLMSTRHRGRRRRIHITFRIAAAIFFSSLLVKQIRVQLVRLGVGVCQADAPPQPRPDARR